MKINAAFLLRSKKVNKYQRNIKGRDAYSGEKCETILDVDNVIKTFGITFDATANDFEKLLAAGERGHKDKQTDLDEAIQSIQRAKELA
jgi:hypothetical protein